MRLLLSTAVLPFAFVMRGHAVAKEQKAGRPEEYRIDSIELAG